MPPITLPGLPPPPPLNRLSCPCPLIILRAADGHARSSSFATRVRPPARPARVSRRRARGVCPVSVPETGASLPARGLFRLRVAARRPGTMQHGARPLTTARGLSRLRVGFGPAPAQSLPCLGTHRVEQWTTRRSFHSPARGRRPCPGMARPPPPPSPRRSRCPCPDMACCLTPPPPLYRQTVLPDPLVAALLQDLAL